MGSTSVFAEWTKVAISDEGRGKDGYNTVYVDLGTIKIIRNRVKIWILHDYNTVQDVGIRYLSQFSHTEYDCKEETSRDLDFYWYSGNMKQGEIVFSQRNIKDEASSIIPGSVGETVLNIACGANKLNSEPSKYQSF